MVTMLTLFLDWRVQLSHRRGAGTALCALAVATGLVLTGCGTETEPVPTATPTSTETAPSTPEPSQSADTPEPTTIEPTPEPTPPDPAQLINENTEEGAKSAAEYFLELRHYTFKSKDDAVWKQLSTKECEVCASVSKGVIDLHEKELSYEGGGISNHEIQTIEEPWPGVWRVDVWLEENAARTQSIDKRVEAELPSSSGTFHIFLKFENEQWHLDEIAK